MVVISKGSIGEQQERFSCQSEEDINVEQYCDSSSEVRDAARKMSNNARKYQETDVLGAM
jgi:hypothetical protein